MRESAAQDTTPSPEYFADFSLSYSEETDRLLQRLAVSNLKEEIEEFVVTFYARLRSRAESAEILARLSHEEFERLKSNQARHLHFLISPGSTPQEHYKRALHVGWVHEMAGVSLPMLLEAYHLYQQRIKRYLGTTGLNIHEREQLCDTLHARLQLDIEAQAASYSRFEIAIVSLLASLEKTIQEASNLADLLRRTVQTLGSFDGISACLFLRPNAQGVMQIEAEGGEQGRPYAEALESRRVPMLEVQANTEGGNGPGGRAWRTGQIQINNSFNEGDAMRPWRGEAEMRGFRSSAAVPLFDQSGQTFAILSLYSGWPGFFSAVTRAAMLRHIQQAMSHAVLHCEQTKVIPADLRRTYWQHLEAGTVEMLYEPVVNLRTGKLDGVEALARLRDAEGQMIEPAAFLPAFGSAGLLRLFQLGLEQVCRDTRMWREQDPPLHLSVGLNIPQDGFIQDAYRDSVFEALSRWELPAGILRLEMLEVKESLDLAKRGARIREFQEAGIGIVQDDLGSGHSSLLRMERIPCDSVKIDQGLVRGALNRPDRALEFIYHLTLLGHGFGIPVAVEGLEDEGLIEAAAILGADHGQGYGIARPMPAQDVTAWNQTWSLRVDPEQPRTALGALAGYLLWDHKLGMLADWPDLAANFIKEPWLVHRYLDHRGKPDPDLSAMVECTQIVALKGQRSHKYVQMRTELIDRLGAIWLTERN